MSKRDTIIIALLVNASLLALLFMLAANTEDDGALEYSSEVAKAVQEKPQGVFKNEKISSKGTKPAPTTVVLADPLANDEVDSFLKDLAKDEKNESSPFAIDDDGYIQLSKEPAFEAENTTSQTKQRNQDLGISENQQYVDVTVKRGDALEKIARANGTTVEAIKKANHLSTAKLSIGQVLHIPTSKKDPVEVKETASLPKQKPVNPVAQAKDVEKKTDSATYYTIKSGDSPWKIAKQHNVPFEELLKLNNLDEERARTLKIGDRIRVK